jgi:CRP/FNR family cyclic AMP-dependent transcriptional regulator
MADLSSIQHAAIFEGFGQSETRELESISRVEQVARGERLFLHGEPANTFYLVRSGSFTLTIRVRVLDDHFEIPIEQKVAGDALGWSALVEPYRSIYSGYCTQSGSVFAFSREDLEEMMSSDPNLGHRFSRNLNQLIGSRMRALQQLWIDEVERSMSSVDYWCHTKLSDEWAEAVHPPRKREHWWSPPTS